MKTLALLKIASFVVLSSTIAACANSKKTIPDPVIPVAALPKPAPAPQIVETPRGPSLTLDNVLFDFDQSTLRPEAQGTIETAADYLKENPQRTALIEGHTDSTGSEDYNQNLSESRSESIKLALVGLGIDENRITTNGLGESNPIADNNDADGRKANRRSEIVFLAK